MRAFSLIPCLALLAAPVSQGVPVVSARPTGDPWEAGSRTPAAPCETIRGEVAFTPPAATRDKAIAMLRTASVRALDDGEAAELLQQKPTDNLLAGLLLPRIGRLQAERTAVLTSRKGSWSEADTAVIAALVSAMQTHYPPYRPYLVRGFSADPAAPSDYVSLHLCGETLQVDSTTQGLRPRRSPLIVFLQSPPTAAAPLWFAGPAAEGKAG